ncbi:MAG: hypothetical protein GF364_11925 [Candidatus Lokiarchaeota archaeon]|nr:hypothetical protein [Candidatus Lokiarchaeota archaeon]
MSYSQERKPGVSVEFGDRVFIVFMADEEERILDPIQRAKPDRIYLFIYESESYDRNYENHYPNIEKGIKEVNQKTKIIKKYVTFINYFEVIHELSKIIKKEREKNPNTEIIMHCGVGSKISAIAVIDACRIWNAKPIYVYSKDYDPKRDIKHKGEMILFEPPVFPLQKEKWEHIETIRIIDNMIKKNREQNRYTTGDKDYIMKSDIQDALLKAKIITTSGKKNTKNIQSRQQMALKQKILDPLKKRGYIELRKKSRSKKVYLTAEGRRIAEIFKYYNPR